MELVPLLTLEQQVSIGTKLGDIERDELVKFLRANTYVFAWSHEDMLGIDPKVTVHHFNIDLPFRLVK